MDGFRSSEDAKHVRQWLIDSVQNMKRGTLANSDSNPSDSDHDPKAEADQLRQLNRAICENIERLNSANNWCAKFETRLHHFTLRLLSNHKVGIHFDENGETIFRLEQFGFEPPSTVWFDLTTEEGLPAHRSYQAGTFSVKLVAIPPPPSTDHRTKVGF